jgi:hypothetical protein
MSLDMIGDLRLHTERSCEDESHIALLHAPGDSVARARLKPPHRHGTKAERLVEMRSLFGLTDEELDVVDSLYREGILPNSHRLTSS